MLSRGRDDLLRLEDVVRARLLDVHVLARLARPDRLQRVPMVRRGERHGVDGLVFEQLSEVDVGGRLLQPFRLESRQLGGDVGLIDVAQSHDLDIGDLRPACHMAASPPAAAHDRHPDRLVRARQTTSRRAAGQHGRAHQEMSSIHVCHVVSLTSRQ